jgi:hypothetical protein
LADLEAWLGSPPESRRREMPHVRGRWFSSAQLEPHELPRVQELYRRVVAAKGTGKSFAEEALLSLIACALEPSAVPFFVEVLSVAPPRDQLAAQRRKYALAALALLAYLGDEGALTALLDATHHPHPQARALAAYYLRAVFVGVDEVELELSNEPAAEAEDDAELELRRDIPPQISARMGEMATHDPAFEPRFMARAFLRDTGQPVPLDNPDGVYAFKVKFMYAKRIYRTIELRSKQTLEDLHSAIQRAIRWDDDHLYSFFLNGERWDERYRFASPLEEDAPVWTSEGVIGELGLTLKHKFLYYFDYGDSHEFEVEVVGIRPKAEPGRYPRVVESKGKAPAQYYYGDEEDDEDLENEE